MPSAGCSGSAVGCSASVGSSGAAVGVAAGEQAARIMAANSKMLITSNMFFLIFMFFLLCGSQLITLTCGQQK
jgi:hypothetical protein